MEEARQEKRIFSPKRYAEKLKTAADMLLFEPILRKRALSAAGRLGVTLSDAESLYALGRARSVVFGRTALCDRDRLLLWDCYATGDPVRLLCLCGAIGAHSVRPAARALAAAAETLHVPLPAVRRVSEDPDGGMTARAGGRTYRLGSLGAFRKAGVPVPAAACFPDMEDRQILYVAENGEFVGFFLLCPALFPQIGGVTAALPEIGVRGFAAPDAAGLAERAGLAEISEAETQKCLRKKKKNVTITIDGGKVQLPCGETVSVPSPYALYGMLLLGRLTRQMRLQNLALCIVLLFVFFSLVPLSPLLAILAVLSIRFAKTAADLYALSHFSPRMPAAKEEEPMFGKVSYTMRIEGMSCAHCSARVKAALEALRGVSAEISLEEKTARVRCPASLSAEKLADAVTAAGYTVVATERV